MQYVIQSTPRSFESLVWWENVFTNDELDYLQQIAKSAVGKGVIGTRADVPAGTLDEQVRRNYIEWLPYSERDHWLFEKIGSVIKKVNDQYFGFNIHGLAEPIQLTNYKSEERGTYGWHLDTGLNIIRKLSFIMQLSDPSEYDGGEIQIKISGTPTIIPKKRGYITIIPSFILHQVTPVTRGSRQSLVSWISGPEFK